MTESFNILLISAGFIGLVMLWVGVNRLGGLTDLTGKDVEVATKAPTETMANATPRKRGRPAKIHTGK